MTDCYAVDDKGYIGGSKSGKAEKWNNIFDYIIPEQHAKYRRLTRRMRNLETIEDTFYCRASDDQLYPVKVRILKHQDSFFINFNTGDATHLKKRFDIINIA